MTTITISEPKESVCFEELKRIKKKNNGILQAEKVVEEAKNKNSVLHSYFIWDDSIAAERYRVEQARTLIRGIVAYAVSEENSQEIRGFVSLATDRRSEGGGYRYIVEILGNLSQRKQLIEDAKVDMQNFMNKYRTLKELDDVLGAIGKVLG